jgi:hypothetical protein
MRFDLRRLLRQKLGRFFGFAFLLALLVQVGTLYLQYLVDTKEGFAAVKDFAHQVLSQGAEYQAGLMTGWITLIIFWLFMATVGGGLVARDTLYRIRPLLYAHPVRPMDYLLAKGGLAAAMPMVIQLTFILVPWLVSMLIAGKNGPIWPTTVLRLLPAVIINGAIFGSVVVGASSLASTPRAGGAWVLGIVLGTTAIGSMVAGILSQTGYMALSPLFLVNAWPQLCCGMQDPMFGWTPALLGTAFHVGLWTFLAWKRTRPSEAIL